MTSRAWAYSCTTIERTPFWVWAYYSRDLHISISIAPPPGTIPLFLIKLLNTQRASWILLSASSITKSEIPLTKIVEVLHYSTSMWNTLAPSDKTNWWASFALVDNFSGVKLSIWATGIHPKVWQIKGTSVLSISFRTMIFYLFKKWTARSLRASLRMDF